jgi:hypothetical protein
MTNKKVLVVTDFLFEELKICTLANNMTKILFYKVYTSVHQRRISHNQHFFLLC